LLPGRHAEPPQDRSCIAAAQRLDLVRRDTAEAEFVGDAVQDPHEPGKAVRQRAVEIENDELVFQ
jgi:hypothetical protein